MRLSTLAAAVLPDALYRHLRDVRVVMRERSFFAQGEARLECGNYSLTVPANHPLLSLRASQPLRDLNIGVAARYVSAKYPNALMVDIGANVGDTGAIIASSCGNPLLLIEGSDFFHRFLECNASLLGDRARTLKCLIGSGRSVSGKLHHWGGTAYFEQREGEPTVRTVHLDDVVREDVCFIKIDTDGFDYDIVLSHLDFLAARKPALIFENQVCSAAELQQSIKVFEQLIKAGYEGFVFWDDPGFYVVSTRSIETIVELNTYLFSMWSLPAVKKSIANYDVLCVHRDDDDVFQAIRRHYRATGAAR